MMSGTREHRYSITTCWTGNLGSGTSGYRSYSRDHEIRAKGKPHIGGSSDPAFQGDPTRWNPEDLLVASLSACHKLWFLHLAAEDGIVVTAYTDEAEGVMEERPDSAGRFTSVVLRPTVTVTVGSNNDRVNTLHHVAHEKCFIANSVNFPVACEPKIVVAGNTCSLTE
jgi:organic hydroperoxide reductase OsmC/OhrA